MNVRKPMDYGAMYRELSTILAQNFCRRISLTAQAFPRAMCARYAIFTRLMKMTKNSYGRSS